MAEAEAGLELPIGLTEQKFLQQLARIEARAIKASNAMSKKFVDGNKQIGDSFKSAEASAEVFTQELDAMKAKFDPVYTATKRYDAALDELNKAHRLGVVTTKQYDAAVAELGAEYRRTSAAAVGLSRGTRASLQNVSYQLQDIFVQISGGQGVTRALSQQLPQLASGFGLVGSAIGLAAGLAIPLAASFFKTAEEAKTLDEAIQDLSASLGDYYEAVENANVPTQELIDKYGTAAGSAQLLLAQLAQIAKLDAASALRGSAGAIGQSFDGLLETLGKIEAAQNALAPEDFLNEGTAAQRALTAETERLREEYGLTIEQAQELRGILQDQRSAASVQEQAAAMLRLAEFLGIANEQAGYTNEALIEANKAAAEGALAAHELSVAMDGAAAAAGGVVDTVSTLPGTIDAATASAINLSRALAAAIGAAQAAPGAIGLSLDRFGDGKSITQRAGGMDLQEQQAFRYDWLDKLEADEEARRKAEKEANKKPKKPKKPKKETTFADILADSEMSAVRLEREISLIGKSNREVAEARARWEALDAAKKAGITVTAKMSEQIDAQAAKMGELTEELERGEQAQQRFDEAVDGIADAMAGALVAGESLRDGLAQVLKGIASDILKSGIRNLLLQQFNVGSGFNLFSLFGGGDALSGALGAAGAPVRSFDGGGFTGMGSRSGGIDGKGGFPAILHPNETVVDHTKGQRMGGSMTFAPTIHVGGSVTQEDIARIHQALEVEKRNFNQNVRKAQADNTQRYG